MTKNYRASAGIMLAPAVALIGVFILLPMLLTVWLSFQDWSTQTPFGTASFIGLRQLSRHLWVDVDRPGLQGRARQHRALHRNVGGTDPAAVGRARPDGLPAIGRRRHDAQDSAVFDLHGADDRRGAGVVEALFADGRTAQPDARPGRHRAAAMALIARAPRWCPSCCSMCGSRSAISPCSRSPA